MTFWRKEDPNMTQEDHLKILPEKILRGFRFLFIMLTLAMISETAIGWEWLQYIITFTIFATTVMLVVIVRQVEKKRERIEYEKKQEEEKEED